MNRRRTDHILRTHSISDRVMAVDLQTNDEAVRFISVCLPHRGYAWAEFIQVMDEISLLASRGESNGLSIVTASDFNLSLESGLRGERLQDL